MRIFAKLMLSCVPRCQHCQLVMECVTVSLTLYFSFTLTVTRAIIAPDHKYMFFLAVRES